MKRADWKRLTSEALEAREVYPKTIYVHIIVLPGGVIFTVTPTKDRAAGRRKIYPKLNPWGFTLKDFNEVQAGEYGKVITTFFLPKQELLDRVQAIDPSDPITFGEQEEPTFYGMYDIPEYDYDNEAEFNTGEARFEDKPITTTEDLEE